MELAIIVLALSLVVICGLFVYSVRNEGARNALIFKDALETLKAQNLREKIDAEGARRDFDMHRKYLEEAYQADIKRIKKLEKEPHPSDVALTEDGREILISNLEPVTPSEIKWSSYVGPE